MKLPVFDMLLKTAMSSSFQITSEQEYKLLNMQSCRTIVRGGQIITCPDCGTQIVLYKPCNQRGCVFCYLKNQIKWEINLKKRLLPISHYHLVFSVPEVFTVTWLKNKEALTKVLFSSVSESIREVGKECGVLFGSVLVFQSHGKGMCRKIHVHCALTAGGLSDKKKWIGIESLQYSKLVEKMQDKVYKKLELAVSVEDLPYIKKIDNREYTVYSTFQKNGKSIVKYLSHSIFGVVINMHQQFRMNEENGTIVFSEDHSGRHTETILSNEEFTKRYLSHIPPPGLVMVRSYGLYSNRHKEELEILRKELFEIYGCEENEEEQIKYFCPVCQAEMFVDIIFSANSGEWPLYIKYLYFHDPPEHGGIILKVKKTA